MKDSLFFGKDGYVEIYTIGHSSHTKEMFLNMLHAVSIEVLVDVRSFPGSRKFPAFSKDVMSDWLSKEGIAYDHFPQLGGRRSRSEMVGVRLNDGWENESFHNYADYTLSDPFQEGIQELEDLAIQKNVAYFCAERHPARCHRLLISNWLQAHGWEVKHIIDNNTQQTEVISHVLGKWGAMPIIEENGTVVYPG